jgi:3-methyladenine DNA glycosylase/8-oxoguanine DNA glycosylase
MELDPRVCDRARRSRDARFDGRFFRIRGHLSARELDRRSERWRPWRAYALMLLWQTASEATS